MHISCSLEIYRVPNTVLAHKDGGYRIENLEKIVEGPLWIGFHSPVHFSDDLEAGIRNNAEALTNVPLLVRTKRLDNETYLSQEPIVIENIKDIPEALRVGTAKVVNFIKL